MKGRFLLTIFVTGTMGLAGLTAAHASLRRGGGQEEALAKAQYLLQQVSAERDALKEKNGKLQGKVDDLQHKVKELKKTLGRKKKDLSASDNALAQYKERSKLLMDRLMTLRDKFKEVIARFRKTIGELRQVEADRNRLKATLQNRTHEVKACIKKNIELYQTDLELVSQYRHKGVWAALLQEEPVTGLKKVEVENAVQKYKSRLEKLRVVNPIKESSRQ